jgi:hypothetical protein
MRSSLFFSTFPVVKCGVALAKLMINLIYSAHDCSSEQCEFNILKCAASISNYLLLRTNVNNAIFKIQILSTFLSVLFLSVSSKEIVLELRDQNRTGKKVLKK